jgi:hypothetical protein
MSLGYTMLDMAHHYEVIRGIQGDGTSNNAIEGLVRRVIAALSVIAVAIFAVRGVMVFASGDSPAGGAGGASSDKTKKLATVGTQFVIVMIFIFGAWGIASLVSKVAQGAF